MSRLFPQPFRLVRAIVWINIAVSLISVLCFTFGWPDVLREWMPLSWAGLAGGRWWECFTYMWIHAQFVGMGILHIVCNMMTLSSFGRTVEESLGPKSFLGIYFAGGLGGSMAYVIERALRHALLGPDSTPDPGMVGASAAVLGVVVAFSVLRPEARVSILFLPFRFRAGRFMLGFGLVSLVLVFVPLVPFVAHSAHIGGMLGGWLWMRWVVGIKPAREGELPPWLSQMQAEVEQLTPEALRLEAAGVLEKLSHGGMDQLDARERLILARARRELLL